MNESVDCASVTNYGIVRFLMLGAANSIAILGVVWNVTLVRVFVALKPKEPTLAMLACLDSVLCLCYVALFGAQALAYYFSVLFAYNALYSYVLVVFVLSRVVQLCIPAMLILTALQRWCWLSNRRFGAWRALHLPLSRTAIGVVLLFLAACGRFPMVNAMYVRTYSNCTDPLRRKELLSRASGVDWYPLYDILVTIFQALLSFITLVTLNAAIVRHLRSRRLRRQGTLHDIGKMKKERRNATANLMELVSKVSEGIERDVQQVVAHETQAIYTMAVIVATCLVCNSLHIILTLLEKWGEPISMTDKKWSHPYLVASDVMSFLFMLSSAARLLVYYKLNPRLRGPLNAALCCQRARADYSEIFLRQLATDEIELSVELNEYMPQRKYAIKSHLWLGLSTAFRRCSKMVYSFFIGFNQELMKVCEGKLYRPRIKG